MTLAAPLRCHPAPMLFKGRWVANYIMEYLPYSMEARILSHRGSVGVRGNWAIVTLQFYQVIQHIDQFQRV